MGSDLIQSILIAELMTQTIKYSVRRERPDKSNTFSFSSGHAADTMAFATALERHFNWKYYVPAYAFATYVAKGYKTAGLGVDLTNPTGAYPLYTAVGMRPAYEIEVLERSVAAAP